MKPTTSSLRSHIRSRVLFSWRIFIARCSRRNKGIRAIVVVSILVQGLLLTGAKAEAPASTLPIPPEAAALAISNEINVGPFCLSNIPLGAVVVGRPKIEPSVVWWDIKIAVPVAASAKPTIYFFSQARHPPAHPGPTRCSDSASLAVVKGVVNFADISALYSPPSAAGPGQWFVYPKMLDAEFTTAEAGINSIYRCTSDCARRD